MKQTDNLILYRPKADYLAEFKTSFFIHNLSVSA